MCAFDELYARYRRPLLACTQRMLGDAHAAEDVVQGVFLSVWNAPHMFRGGSVRAWLVTIAVNRTRDTLRRQRSSARRLTAVATATPAAVPFTDDVIARLQARELQLALRELPDEQRTLIERGFFEFRTHDELARLSGLPLGTVKTRIRAGLRRLRRTLEIAS
jgi:RNA polymerase sigma-70 factor (ECF subfamily)